jgi:hypothetical protein
MRLFISIALLLNLSYTYTQGDNIHINPSQLIEKKINWEKFEKKDESLKRAIINSLIDQKMIFLCHSGTISGKKDLDKFMSKHSKSFHLVDLNADGTFELVFNGFDCDDVKNEFLYIYIKKEEKYGIAYTKKGNIIGYNVNPHTRELLLIHFNYPCCKNGTNNLNTLRLVDGQITEFRKEFFAGRKDFMKGPFLPDSIDRNGQIIKATKLIELRWSPERIDTLAWNRRSNQNIIIAYPTSSKFRVLAEQKNRKGEKWLFVISKSKPIQNKPYIVEPSSFINTRVYGWIKDGDY